MKLLHAVVCAVAAVLALSATAPAAVTTSAKKPQDNSPANLSCVYWSPLDGDQFSRPNCAWRDHDGRLHVSATHLRRLDFDKDGLARVNVDGWYWVNREGRLAAAMTFDNGADYFVEGRARSPRNGKIGYIDRHLTLIIPARYDGALPFDQDFAVVCKACTTTSAGEHSWYVGGRWSCIDRRGRERSPFRALKPGEGVDAVCSKYRRR